MKKSKRSQNVTSIVGSINTYFNFGKNILMILSGIYGGLSKIVNIDTVKKFITQKMNIDKQVLDNIISLRNIAIWTLNILLVITILKFIYNAIRSSAHNNIKMFLLLKRLHLDFVHNIRSKIVEMEKYLPEKIKNTTKENMEHLYNQELKNVQTNIQPYVDSLSDYLSSYRNRKISVCIKSFVNGSRNKTDYLNEQIITLARSKNTRNARNSFTSSVVGNNSDFIDLCCGRSMFFGKTNLKKLYDDNLYFNDSPRWWKQYNSTLVAPIRYFDKDKHESKLNIEIDVIGFLCIDCKDNIKEWENPNSFDLQLLAIVADSLYTYLRMFYNYFDNIGYFDQKEVQLDV